MCISYRIVLLVNDDKCPQQWWRDEPHRYRFRVGFKHKGYLAAKTKILGREKGLAASKMTD